MKTMHKKRGSSLLLVMLITAGIVTVIFGTQRLALVQFSQASREEDNINALYAAKAGIEDGLIRARYNKNIETAENQVFRFNLADGKNIGTVESASNIAADASYSPTKEFYDLNIKYRDTSIGDLTNKANAQLINRDTSTELSGFAALGNNDYYLRYLIWFEDAAGNPVHGNDNCLVQIQEYKQDGTPVLKVVTSNGLLKDVSAGLFDSAYSGNGNLQISSGGSVASTVRFLAIGCNARLSAQGVFGETGTEFAADIDVLKTTITATGYYGSAKRTLIAEIDRLTGNLLTVYEFTGYAGQGSITP